MTGTSETLRVALGERAYDIVIGDGLIDALGASIHETLGKRACWVVTDETVGALYLARALASLSQAGLTARAIVLPPGEATKNFGSVERIVNEVLDDAPERSSALIALGGGVVGDLTGFAASAILRGIGFVQVPTTLLSQVDSSVGGKTGINTRHGKNLVGAFYQPRLVLADTATLDTLPRREVLAGYAEVVKYGLIRDAGFFAWLEDGNGARLLDGDAAARRHAVRESCAAKAAVVAVDERETGERALLNFGHTFGHALEAETGFSARLLHGEAVSIGMIMAFELSAALGYCDDAEVERVRRHFSSVGLPTAVPALPGDSWDAGRLIDHMAHDKKVRDGRVTFILARSIGDAFIAADVNPADVATVVQGALAA